MSVSLGRRGTARRVTTYSRFGGKACGGGSQPVYFVSMETPEPLASLRVVGGHLALDLLNTRSGPPEGPFELEGLTRYADVVAWAARAALVSDAAARRLLERAERRPAEAREAFARALRLREELHAVFGAVAAGRRPAAADLDALKRAELEALAGAELAPGAAGVSWSWAGDERLTSPLWPALHAATELLVRGPLDRVKACGGCSYLFLDDSKNRSR